MIKSILRTTERSKGQSARKTCPLAAQDLILFKFLGLIVHSKPPMVGNNTDDKLSINYKDTLEIHPEFPWLELLCRLFSHVQLRTAQYCKSSLERIIPKYTTILKFLRLMKWNKTVYSRGSRKKLTFTYNTIKLIRSSPKKHGVLRGVYVLPRYYVVVLIICLRFNTRSIKHELDLFHCFSRMLSSF